jgi:predicted glycogen debranching enzyme
MTTATPADPRTLPHNTVHLATGSGRDLPDPLGKEWILTNGLGGYSMGTAPGINTRRYHALLVAALTPPVNRIVALNAVADTLTLDPGGDRAHSVTLTPFHFRGSPNRPTTTPAPCTFTRGIEASWVFRIDTPAGEAFVTKTLHLFDKRNAIALVYDVKAPGRACLTLRPLTALRDFHELVSGEQIAGYHQARPVEGGVMCATRGAGVHLVCNEGVYRHAPDIWHDLEYLRDAERGQGSVEDMFSPGEFVIEGEGSFSATLHATVDAMEPGPIDWDRTTRATRVRTRIDAAMQRAPQADKDDRDAIARLVDAAEDFIVQRGSASEGMVSVIAGYPWFTDWGRDTMISLPGLLLTTRRFEDALGTLRVFAEHRRRGLIPNRFDDRAGPARYNTVDAPLWFLHAAAEYRAASGDHEGYMEHLAPACNDIIDAYRVGTDYEIGMDTDGLIAAGSPDTQLTWMDAQRGGVTFTPRHGKAVEINALWHHGLMVTAEAIEAEFPRRASEQHNLAARARDAFRASFVRADGLGLFDRLEKRETGWEPVAEIRPNQLFAASLKQGPLETDERGSVVRVVRDRLLTPAGVRTLDPADPGYIGRYEGDMFARDKAYHNGTAWPWLIGPYAEAVLRAGGFSDRSRAEAREAIDPLINMLRGNNLGQLPEVFDGDGSPGIPQRADGCPAQAWSVAEPLRVLMMLQR